MSISARLITVICSCIGLIAVIIVVLQLLVVAVVETVVKALNHWIIFEVAIKHVCIKPVVSATCSVQWLFWQEHLTFSERWDISSWVWLQQWKHCQDWANKTLLLWRLAKSWNRKRARFGQSRVEVVKKQKRHVDVKNKPAFSCATERSRGTNSKDRWAETKPFTKLQFCQELSVAVMTVYTTSLLALLN